MRVILALVACLSLAGCWVSEQRLFGAGDWAHLELDGRYKSENANGDPQASVVLHSRPDGLVEGTSESLDDGTTELSVFGFVRIEDGSGQYFLMVDRTKDNDSGDIYFIARLNPGGTLEIYWPDCGGTPARSGMAVESGGLGDTDVCTFSSKEALMSAALEAERFLSAKHIVEVSPMGRMVPDDDQAEGVDE